jgi:lysophospholipase L1-like esterase
MHTKRIMCFGDSLTWGWKPTSGGLFAERYARSERWTGVMASELGNSFEVIEEGLNGRTTDIEDPASPQLSGAAYLPSAIASHLPLDLVILMLGTNDTKAHFARSPLAITMGISVLLRQIAESGGRGTVYRAPAMMLVAPPPLGQISIPFFAELFCGAREKTVELAAQYAAFADILKVPFFDAQLATETSGIDGIHLSKDNNLALGADLARQLRSLAL